MNKFFHTIYNNFKKYDENMNTNYYNKDKYVIYYYNPLITYILGDLVSDKGFFSNVYNVINQENKKKYVMKISKPKDMTPLNEINVLSILSSHKHIVTLYESYIYNNQYYLILQKCNGGNLYNYLKRNIISEKYAKTITKQLINAIEYIHNNFIIVKDIKLENILMKDREYESDIILCDFNLSVILSEEESYTCDRGGTLDYVAPEVIVSQKSYSYKSDIWSLGVVLYYILGRELPFNDINNNIIMKNIAYGKYNFKNKYWNNISENVKDLISNILVTDVQKRYNIGQIKLHSWLHNTV